MPEDRGLTLGGTMRWMRLIEARYEQGFLKPETPLTLTPGERVALIVVRAPNPARWNAERLAKAAIDEDRNLAEQGLAAWADTGLYSIAPSGQEPAGSRRSQRAPRGA